MQSKKSSKGPVPLPRAIHKLSRAFKLTVGVRGYIAVSYGLVTNILRVRKLGRIREQLRKLEQAFKLSKVAELNIDTRMKMKVEVQFLRLMLGFTTVVQEAKGKQINGSRNEN